jgi:hypothetical protein
MRRICSDSLYPSTEAGWTGGGWGSTKCGPEGQWRVFGYHQRSEKCNELWYDNMSTAWYNKMCARNPSKWRMLFHLFQNWLFTLGQKELIIENLKVWVIWNPCKEMLSIIRKFFSCVVAGWLNVGIIWSQKVDYFWKWRRNIFFSFEIMTGLCVVHLYRSTHEWSEYKPTKRELLYNEMFDKQVFERGRFDCGNCNYNKTIWHTSQFWERKSPVMPRITGKEFISFNKDETSAFKACTGMWPEATNFQCHFTLILKMFQSHFKRRWLIRTWEL